MLHLPTSFYIQLLDVVYLGYQIKTVSSGVKCTEFTLLDRLDCGKKAHLEKSKSISIRSITKLKRQINTNIGHSKSENLGPRIVGGTESKMGEWPWQVSLLLNDIQYGGGAILSKDFILTSAHLFTSEK